MKRGRGVVGVLGGAAALFAFAVGAVSLTRIAHEKLGFPPDLEWTLTASVDVAGTAGAVMWTAFTGPVRNIGRPMNLLCTILSGIGVGLDHAAHADQSGWWPAVAFGVGFLLPALVSFMLHSLAVMADRQDAPAGSGSAVHQQTWTGSTGGPAGLDRQHQQHRPAAPAAPAGDRQQRPAAPTSSSPAASTTGRTGSPAGRPAVVASRPALPAAPDRPTAVESPGATVRVLHTFPGPRADWMTEDLLRRVLAWMSKAQRDGESYGRPRLMAAFKKSDGVTGYKADELRKFIDKHGLLKVPA